MFRVQRVPPSFPDYVDGVASKDVPLAAHPPLWVRIFLPKQALHHGPLPVVLYFHGGAYSLGDPDWLPFHAFCNSMAAASTGSIWISVSYRLAPQHRLPAAYDDGLAALRWLQQQASLQASLSSSSSSSPSPSSSELELEPWFSQDMADFSTCFLAGESAGASICFNVALKDWQPISSPLCIHGLLLVHPAFHAEAKRHSMVDASLDNLQVNRFYDLALPEGENLDYPPVNPLNPKGPSLVPLSAYPRILIAVAEQDFRYDMTMAVYDIVKGLCREVRLIVTSGKGHAFHVFEPTCKESAELLAQLVDFMSPRGNIADADVPDDGTAVPAISGQQDKE